MLLNRLRLCGHLHRMNDDVWPKKVTNIHIIGTLPKGRPKLRMTAVVDKDLKDIGIQKELRIGWHDMLL